jgi:hypothetical protein
MLFDNYHYIILIIKILHLLWRTRKIEGWSGGPFPAGSRIGGVIDLGYITILVTYGASRKWGSKFRVLALVVPHATSMLAV